jgi:hypothetical protein
VLASDVISPARDALFDTAGTRWVDAELLRYLSHGQVVIVGLRPDAYALTETIRLAGGTLQSIPTAGTRLLRVVRNRASVAADAGAGRAIRITGRDMLDTENPNWHTSRASARIEHYMVDTYTPRQFYVYPPALGTPGAVPGAGQPASHVEIVYSANPVAVTNLGSTLPLGDQFLTPLVEFVLYRAFAKDSSAAGNMQRAQMHLQAFAQALGLNFSAELQAVAAAPQGA